MFGHCLESCKDINFGLQVLCTVTLGAPGDAQRLDSIVGPPTKRFMLHYSFPPFSINEVAKRGGLNRREVGHGTYLSMLFLKSQISNSYTAFLECHMLYWNATK